jgi:iron complex outermembrane receptor protein
VDNVFDVYPDKNALGDATTAGTNNFGIFPYNQISPFGFNGAFYYGRLTLGF